MRKTQFISPSIKTYETDKSNKSSVYSNTRPGAGAIANTQATSRTPNTSQNFILLENGFYLLQENNAKFIL